MSSYNKQPESALSRSNPTWYFFSITILYIKCMDLKTWSTCISMPVFARVNHRSCISFIFTSPLQTRTCEIPWVQHAWHPGDFWNLRSNLDAINVKSAMFKTRCWWLILLAFRSSDQQTSILQSDGSWTLLIWIVYVNRCLAHWVVNNG